MPAHPTPPIDLDAANTKAHFDTNLVAVNDELIAQLRATGVSTLLVDTSPQPQSSAEQLAAAMGAQYLALPYGGAQSLNQAVRAVAGRN